MNPESEIVVSVSEFVALTNQTLEFAYPSIVIEGELANFRVSKNRWVYFDLKDDDASVKFFGTIYNLPGPLEDGMLLKVRGTPRLHNLYGFSVTIQQINLSGEGTIKRAADLLQRKLAAEGLFAPERKRPLPYPPQRIGLITSRQSAAYADFTKILTARWPLVEVSLTDVQVQGEIAPEQIVAAINQFNQLADQPEVLIIIRGGGSAEDLAAFSTEQVTRAVAASRIPTLVAIGHEIDVSLAELAADVHASTPSNAAELLVPDKRVVLERLRETGDYLSELVASTIVDNQRSLHEILAGMQLHIKLQVERAEAAIVLRRQLLTALSPQAVLERGYAIVRAADGHVVHQAKSVTRGEIVTLQFADGNASATINDKGE